jgi:threonine synthase
MKTMLECSICGRTHPLEKQVYRCSKCDYPLEVRFDYTSLSSSLAKKLKTRQDRSIWRYRELLPFSDFSSAVSLGEGGTPLIKSVNLGRQLGFKNLYIKDESLNPTGSFKDRGSSVGISMARQIGVKAVGCVSTGNMAVSVAAYSARAGLRCVILIPVDTPLQKVLPMVVHGATVIMMEKPYPEIFEAGLEISKEFNIYWIHSDAPMRIEGQKTCAFEIWEQLGQKVPDKVIIPVSSGGNISSHWKGWKELKQIGIINKLPAMIAIQAAGSAPIVRAFNGGQDIVLPLENAKTVAHAICNPKPPSGNRTLGLLYESQGTAAVVSDSEMIGTRVLLAKTEGLLVEISSAAGIAAIPKLLKGGFIKKAETIVCVVTGTGLKDMSVGAKHLCKPLVTSSWADCFRTLRRILNEAN